MKKTKEIQKEPEEILFKEFEKEFPQIKKSHHYIVECLIDFEINEFLNKKKMFEWIKKIKKQHEQVFRIEIIVKDSKNNDIKILKMIP